LSATRVAIIAPFFPRPSTADDDHAKKGGVERYVAELASALPEHGFDVTVVAPANAPGRVGGGAYSTVYFRRAGVMFGSPIFNPTSLFRALEGFDLVHSQATYPLLSDMPALLVRLRGIAGLVTYHFDPSPPSPIGSAMAELYSMSAAKMIKRYDRVIFSSKSYCESSPLMHSLPQDRVRVIPMGVDSNYFVPDSQVERENKLLFVGRLVPYKDVSLLLRAMAAVNKVLPHLELLIVGTGPLESQLISEASALGVRARFLGRVDDAQLLRLYQSATATVLASHNRQEAFGMTLLESMSCGTPVIAANVPGVKEVASISGNPVDPDSHEALAQAMIEAVRSPPSASHRLEIRERIVRDYSWRRVAQRTAEVYRELL
jgi:glycosyltransferase involved in cell wall biosynthesis